MTYDEMILRGPDEPNEVGTQDGETCGRYPEPDEGEPRGYKRKPCDGVMEYDLSDCPPHVPPPCGASIGAAIVCDTCGELA